MVEIRKAVGSDYDSIALLHADSWRRTYRGIYSEKYLEDEVVPDRLAVWQQRFETPASNQQVFVASESGQIIGFACIFLDDDRSYGAFLDNLHIAASHQKQGIGKALMQECATCVVEAGNIQSLYLWVYDSNENAKKVYAKLGCRFEDSILQVNEDGSQSPMSRCVWEDVNILLPESKTN